MRGEALNEPETNNYITVDEPTPDPNSQSQFRIHPYDHISSYYEITQLSLLVYFDVLIYDSSFLFSLVNQREVL